MELTFLGTGTSTGVPQPRCSCEVCTSADPRDSRLRCSVLVETCGQKILIDCGPDFRQQMLRLGRPDDELDALLITHSHYDHTGGIDDLRPYCYNPAYPDGFPVYCSPDVARELIQRLPYCFPDHHYPGAPTLDLHTITAGHDFNAGPVHVRPIGVMHGKLPILGFRIGDLTYITDCKTMPQETMNELKGTVDTLVINALFDDRQIPRKHQTHMNLTEALEVIRQIAPRRTYLTHASHRIGLHSHISATLPPGIHMAFDGLKITV